MITVSVAGMERILSEIIPQGPFESPEVRLTEIGKITDKYINRIPDSYKNVTIDNYVIMPDHVHILLTLHGLCQDDERNVSVDTIIRSTKTRITKDVGRSIWLKGFYDVIADTEKRYNNCYYYITANPVRWIIDGKEPGYSS